VNAFNDCAARMLALAGYQNRDNLAELKRAIALDLLAALEQQTGLSREEFRAPVPGVAECCG
jgi:hypothetical protein